ncbi:MAG: glycyl-radical enzyme activating protein [Oscillospiraceae bacterium]|nr:glycyl-radical enzyme activating protein [Oscillospiraceae bacterium]
MLNVLEISRMATHNGPGYRTTVHFMGCPLRCRWCSTPESQDFTGLALNPSRCLSCGYCVEVCEGGALTVSNNQPVALDRSLCHLCYKCAEVCYSRALWVYGKQYTAQQLACEIIKDKLFFKNSGGGVTLSGGECLMSVNDEFVEMCSLVRDEDVSIGIDTCGYVPWHTFERILEFTDLFLYDIKILNSEKHKEFTGVGNELILENLDKLTKLKTYKPEIVIRYPLIPGVNDTDEDISQLCTYLSKMENISELNFMPYHHLGMSRYKFSGKEYLMGSAERQSNERLAQICEIADSMGINNRIVG